MAAETREFTEQELAIHEAGHAVLAAHLGLPVERVSIVAAPAARSHVRTGPRPAAADPATELVVLLAGEEAQRRRDGGEPRAAGDREQAQRVLAAAGVGEAQGRELLARGQGRARELLAEAALWRRVEAVAAALLAEGTLDAGRFRDLLASA